MTPHKRRAARYARLVRGWDWRTTPELLAEAEKLRQRLGVDKTQLIEDAVRAYIAQPPLTAQPAATSAGRGE